MPNGFYNGVVAADNVDFSGDADVSARVTADGQLLIGSTASPNIRVGTLTAGTGISITNGAGAITIENTGALGAGTITGDSGGALSQTAGNWNIVSTATNGIDTSGSGSTLTIGMASPYSDGNFSFTRAASGAANTLTIANTSNTASSNAILQITTGGTSSNDPMTSYTVTGGSSWTTGIDNTDSDKYKISASTALETTNIVTIDTAGNTTISSTGTAAPLTFTNRQLDAANATSTSVIVSSIVNASTADPYFLASVEASANYCFGIDNSDSDSLKICFDPNSVSASPSGANNFWKCTTAGEITKPLQPAFLAFLPTDDDNVTGAGVSFTIGSVTALTEVFDQGSDFNTNGTFTAPVTGRYRFNAQVYADDGTTIVAATSNASIVTSNRSYLTRPAPGGGNVNYNATISVLADMDAADTATFVITCASTGQTVDVVGGGLVTYFSGNLEC